MRNQDRNLLTTSTRLLNAQVKKAELKIEKEKREGSQSPLNRGDNQSYLMQLS